MACTVYQVSMYLELGYVEMVLLKRQNVKLPASTLLREKLYLVWTGNNDSQARINSKLGNTLY